MTTRQQYRPDIDGLRAISVIAVMVFHFFPSLLPGGFIGVDVFFVISGFLVTKSIVNDLQAEKFSHLGFYARRIRRIVPATLPVFITCLIFGAIFTLTEDNSEIGEKVLYSVGMLQNVFLVTKSDYFVQATELNSFTHFWSLSIEEQFYLLWAPMVYLAYRSFRNHLWALPVGIFFLSFILNLVLIRIDPKLAFYLLPTRMWELVAGAGLCVLSNRLSFSDRQQNLISGASLAMLGGAFVFISANQSYPGFLALIPVLSTVMYVSTPGALLNRLLTTKVVVTTGTMSYSLYLWHWPLLSLFNTLFPAQMTPLDLTLLFIATFFISYLSYVMVELPARKIPEFRAARFFLVGVAVVSMAAGFIAASDGKLILHPELEESAASIEDYDYDRDPHLTPDFCKGSGIKYCLLSDPKKPPTIALMGDSHASHWFPGMRKLFDARNENVLLVVQDRTPPLLGVITPWKEFTDMSEAFRIVLETPTIHTVVLSAFWSIYGSDKSVKVGKEFMKIRIRNPSIKQTQPAVVFATLLAKTLTVLKKAGKEVIFFHDIPTTPFLGDKSMPRPYFETGYPICAFEKDVCTFPYAGVREIQSAYRNLLTGVLSKIPGVKVIDPLALFCDEGSGECLSHPNGKMVYWDEHHISVEGSRYLIPKLFKTEF